MQYFGLDSLATSDVENQVNIAGVSILTANTGCPRRNVPDLGGCSLC